MSEIKREIVGEEKAQMFPYCDEIEKILPTLSITGTVHAYELTNGEYRITIKPFGHPKHLEYLNELWQKAGQIARGDKS